MTADDPYAVLGVPNDARTDDIRRAWVALARRHHPDRGGDAAAMQAVNDAWALLGDPARRRVWDRQHGIGASPPLPPEAETLDGVPDADAFDATPLLPPRRSPTDLLPAALFAAAVVTGCLAIALDVPALLAPAAFLFFLSCIAVAAVAMLSLRRSVRAGRR